jgi:proteasome lid subunit RPN8/RPN11
MSIELSKPVYDSIRDHGAETYPYECCGFMFGTCQDDKRVVTEIKMQTNESQGSRENRFLITPDSFKRAEDYADEIDQVLLGFYHSHPDSPAIPSQYDLDHAWPWYSYIILSVIKSKPDDLFSWKLRDDRSGFDSENVQIVDDNPIEKRKEILSHE